MIRIHTVAPVTFALLISGVSSAQGRGYHREVLAMGTRLSLSIEGGEQDQLVLASEAALVECSRIEAACSTWKPDSVFCRLNGANGQSVLIDREWLDLLSQAQDWSRRTGGRF